MIAVRSDAMRIARRCFGSAAFFFAVVLPASAAPATDTPVATVRSFYDWDDTAWHDAVSYVMGASLRDHLFSRRFAALVAADEHCQQVEQGICTIDHNPWIDGQDGETNGLRFALERSDGTRAVVAATFNSFGKDVTLRFDLLREGTRGWRIDDIHGRTVKSLAATLCEAFCRELPAALRTRR